VGIARSVGIVVLAVLALGAVPATASGKPPKPKPRAATVGDTVRLPTTSDVNGHATKGKASVTLHSYLQPWVDTQPGGHLTPDGFEEANLDVEVCDVGQTPITYNAVVGEWTLELPDHRRLSTDIIGAPSELASGDLQAGDCIRGGVYFQVPSGQRPITFRVSTAKFQIPKG
jgi:hypothetical protein